MIKVLYVNSTPAMKDTTCGVLRTISESDIVDAYAVIFVSYKVDPLSQEALFESYQINASLRQKILFINYPKSSFRRVLNFKTYVDKVLAFAKKNAIEQIHFLTQDVFFAKHISLFKPYKLHYLVHDVVHHVSSPNPLKKLKINCFLTMPDKKIRRRIESLTTCSIHQFSYLKKAYPEKKIHFHNMPSAITRTIKLGDKHLSELNNIDNYILFFGKIEAYKGIHLLYNIFATHPAFVNRTLVIAGSGSAYFSIKKKENIVLVNRFIADEEINHLFSKADILVLPYLSATQSAVSSFAYHFNIPLVASDTPGLSDTVINNVTGLLFKPGSEAELAEKMLLLLSNKALYTEIKEGQNKLAEQFYNERLIKEQLEQIYII